MKTKNNPVNDVALIAACGLYCGACPRFLNDKCPGCRENKRAGWCKIRSCCLTTGIANCARCRETGHARCKTFNNIIGRIFSWIFRSNRPACIDRIAAVGEKTFAGEMTSTGRMTIKR